jgi:carbamoyltransferase
MKKILGISAFYHDSAAALLHDDTIVGAAQEARFSRNKHDDSFPTGAIDYCLKESGNQIDDLDAVVFYDKPFRKFERLLETYYAYAPSGLKSFLSSIPVWIQEKLFQKKFIKDELQSLGEFDEPELNLLFSEHHLSHAASAFFPSPFDESAILTLDGVGEWATTTIGQGNGSDITIEKELQFPHSIGLLYSSFTYYLGFKVNSGEYKVMGLAPYGDPTSDRVNRFEDIILEEIIDLKSDGSFAMDQRYFHYTTGLRMVDEDRWESLFGFPRRPPESEIKQVHCDLALANQRVTEKIIFKLAKHAREITGSSQLCLAGGVALNCVANGKLMKKDWFDDIWIQPAAGDAGGALGSAYAIYHQYFDCSRQTTRTGDGNYLSRNDSPYDNDNPDISDTGFDVEDPTGVRDKMQGAFLGPAYSDKDIVQMARQFNAPYTRHSDFENLCEVTANKIRSGNIIGWFQGRMEWGPRALGNRSILADPRDDTMQRQINKKIKYRESFRPFAPSVLAEDATDYFDLGEPSPYMILIANVLEDRRKTLPDDYHQRSLEDKLKVTRSDIPSVTHLDFTARLQTVHRETNPRYYALIEKFKGLTGYGIVINTSFNLRGEPIVCTPDEAYRCFMRSKMDFLVMGNYTFDRSDQPHWPETREEWRAKIDLD